ncbi:MAG: cytochrome c [Phycisphaerales bacterium]|nr:cytochrome c [Phycisphaerales bacterium]
MKSTACALTLAAALAMFAGCGGDKESSSSSDTNTGTAAPQVDNAMLARAKGKAIFKSTCAACHGEDGKGLPNLGKDWTTSEFIANSTDEEMLEFINAGRSIEDPANTTGVLMPPKGGNPSLTDEDIKNVIAYMRSLVG